MSVAVDPTPFTYEDVAWRNEHKAESADGAFTARVAWASELSMSGPTAGPLVVTTGHCIPRCSPHFAWATDAPKLAALQWVLRFGLLRRQRVIVFDAASESFLVSRRLFRLLHITSFSSGEIEVVDSPFRAPVAHRLSLAAESDFVARHYVVIGL